MNEEIRALVATASRILAAAGQGDLIWGHASARDPDGHGVWLKSARWGSQSSLLDLRRPESGTRSGRRPN